MGLDGSGYSLAYIENNNMGKSSVKRYHHFVPKLYLKGFVEDGSTSFIWVYQRGKDFKPGSKKGKNNPWRSSIKKEGRSEGYYACTRNGGAVDFNTFENILEKQEKTANQVIRKIRNREPLGEKEKALFSSYITLMIKRVPKREPLFDRVYFQKLDEGPLDTLQRLFQEHGQFGKALELVRLREAWRQKPDKEIKLRALVADSKRVPKMVSQMKWVFCVAPPDEPFITSDSPVAYPETHGLGKSDSFLVFPISSMIALVATWEGTDDRVYLDAPAQVVAWINRITMANAHEHLYCCEADSQIVSKWSCIGSGRASST